MSVPIALRRDFSVLFNASDLGMTLRYQGAADAARKIGVRVQPRRQRIWSAIYYKR